MVASRGHKLFITLLVIALFLSYVPLWFSVFHSSYVYRIIPYDALNATKFLSSNSRRPEDESSEHVIQFYGSKDEADSRSRRFPSVDERVRIYMSNWYLPECNATRRILYHSKNQTSLTYLVQEEQKGTAYQRVIKAGADPVMDRIFYAAKQEISKCVAESPKGLRRYCTDVQKTLSQLLELQAQQQLRESSPPMLFQFGDTSFTTAATSPAIVGRTDIHPRVPHFKKFRQAISRSKLEHVVTDVLFSDADDNKTNRDDAICRNPPSQGHHPRAMPNMHLQPIIWKLNTERHYIHLREIPRWDIPWQDKMNQAIFRGALTGSSRVQARILELPGNDVSKCLALDRCRVVYRHANSTLVDAKLTKTDQLINSNVAGVPLMSSKVPIAKLLQYKMILILEGNDVSSGLKWAMLSGSVVLMPPPRYTSWAMEERLEPWVHYVPVENLDNIDEQVRWVLRHDAEAQRIAHRGSLWIKDLVLHPDAEKDDEAVYQEIIRRYQKHFVRSENLGISSIYDSIEEANARSSRFPSVEERVKIYMSNWYIPECNDSRKIHYSHQVPNANTTTDDVTSSGLTFLIQEEQDIKAFSRVVTIGTSVGIDHMFHATQQEISTCASDLGSYLRHYCLDAEHSMRSQLLLQARDKQDGGFATPPLLLQFGDSSVAKVRTERHIRVPHFHKFRTAISHSELERVTAAMRFNADNDSSKHSNRSGTACWDHAAKVPHAMLPSMQLQPIISKMNSRRHYHDVSDVPDWDIPWQAKRNVAIFRGDLTGFGRVQHNATIVELPSHDVSKCLALVRCRVAYLHANSTLVDAKLTHTVDLVDSVINDVPVLSPFLDIKQQLQYKMLLILEGNDVSSALKWALMSKSVVLMPPPTYTSWAMEERLEPWVHYVPIENLDNIDEQVLWVLRHDAEAQRIAHRGSLWIKDLVLHPEAEQDDEAIYQEIIRRYQQHFVYSNHLDVPLTPQSVNRVDSPSSGIVENEAASSIESDSLVSVASMVDLSKVDITVGVYYYPWHADDFHGGGYLRKKLSPQQLPILGEYDDRRSDVIGQHLEWSRQANIKLWVVSWWGKQDRTDNNTLEVILPHKELQDHKIVLFYETERRSDFKEVADDVSYICERYFSHANYLRIKGKPALVIYLTRAMAQSGTLEMFVAIVRQAAQRCGYDVYLIGDDDPDSANVSLEFLDAVTRHDVYGKVREMTQNGYAGNGALDTYYSAHARWRQQAIARKVGFIPGVTPGFNDHGVRQGNPALSRKLNATSDFGSFFRASLHKAASLVDSSTDNLLFVTSWNQWHEDTQIEPVARSNQTKVDVSSSKTNFTSGLEYEGYGSRYLDILREATNRKNVSVTE